MIVRQYLQHVHDARQRRAELHDLRPRETLAHHGQHFGEAECADQHRDQPEAARKVGIAEREALIGIHAVLPDAGDEQAEEAREPALDRIGGDHVAGEHDAEQRQPEELERAELQRDLAEQRREQREADEAEQRADHRAGGRDAHRASGLSLPRELIAVDAGGRVRGGARDVEQDRSAAAAVDRTVVGADQHEDRLVRLHLQRQRGEQRDDQRGGKARHAAGENAEQRRAEGERQRGRGEIPGHAVREHHKAVEHQGSRTRKMYWKT